MTASSPSAARAAVDQLEGLLAGATPGPWKADSRGEVYADDAGFDLHRFDLMETWVATARERDADAALIAAAVNALPHLLAAIKAVDELAGLLERTGQDNRAFAKTYPPSDVRRREYNLRAACKLHIASQVRAALALAAVDVTETAE